MARRRRRKKKGLTKYVIIAFVLVLVVVAEIFFIKGNIGLFSLENVDNIKDILNPETKVEEKKLKIVDVNSNSRPIAIMINNHPTARQYHMGLQDAYLVYEIIVEGGFTRYMAAYKDKDLSEVGSVRSSRHYFLDYALENDAIYVHWGWSDMAKSDIPRMGVNNINGLYYEGKYFYRKNLGISLEHTGFTNSDLINKGINDLGYRKTSDKEMLLDYSIDEIDLSKMDGAIPASDIDIEYSSNVTTSYKYNSENKNYLRFVNGEKHTDYATKEQYTVKNIIIYQVSNYTLSGDVKGRQDIDNLGSGSGYLISDGYAVPINWAKKARSSQTVYTLKNGMEIKVNDGNTFIQIQPKNRKLTIS